MTLNIRNFRTERFYAASREEFMKGQLRKQSLNSSGLSGRIAEFVQNRPVLREVYHATLGIKARYNLWSHVCDRNMVAHTYVHGYSLNKLNNCVMLWRSCHDMGKWGKPELAYLASREYRDNPNWLFSRENADGMMDMAAHYGDPRAYAAIAERKVSDDPGEQAVHRRKNRICAAALGDAESNLWLASHYTIDFQNGWAAVTSNGATSPAWLSKVRGHCEKPYLLALWHYARSIESQQTLRKQQLSSAQVEIVKKQLGKLNESEMNTDGLHLRYPRIFRAVEKALSL